MSDLDRIKKKVKQLYLTNPDIHISVSLAHSRIRESNIPAKIKAVYSNIFRIETESAGIISTYTVMYVDLLTGNVSIEELHNF